MTYNQDRTANLLQRRNINWDDVALLGEVGSTMHGINIADQDDLDLICLRWEPWHELVNGPPKRQSLQIRTQPDGVRSRVGDIDIQVLTLRKFTALALKLNPSILNTFYLPQSALHRIAPDVSGFLRRLAQFVASKQAAARYLGYMTQQMERWRGVRGQKNVNRPELVEAYGYDTKYAGHIIRLGYQGIEYLCTGRITLPMPSDQADLIRSVRTGAFAEAEALSLADQVRAELIAAETGSPLPQQPNQVGAEDLLASFYRLRYCDQAAWDDMLASEGRLL